jgi:hypothetical protein
MQAHRAVEQQNRPADIRFDVAGEDHRLAIRLVALDKFLTTRPDERIHCRLRTGSADHDHRVLNKQFTKPPFPGTLTP